MQGPNVSVIPEDVVPGKRLGRSVIQHDPRSRNFPMRGLLGAAPRNSKIWWRRGVFNQGETSTCVGQTIMGLANTGPFRSLISKELRLYSPFDLYRLAQTADEWDGEEPTYHGTSTLGGMAAAKHIGLIKEYRWCFGLGDVLDTLANHGPVAIGTNWYSSFDNPGYDGRIKITKGATLRGGHETELVSVNFEEQTVRGANSWGPGWGAGGRFEMTFATLDRLLNEQGEAATFIL